MISRPLVFTLVFFMRLSGYISGQQIEYNPHSHRGTGYSYDFGARFRGPVYETFSLRNMTLYKKMHVKKISIYGGGGQQLYYTFEIDTAGHIFRYGVQLHYFTTREWRSEKRDRLFIECWYNDTILVRKDITRSRYLVKKDRHNISARYTRHKVKVYKRGLLLNEQNTFYNNHYLNKVIRYEYSEPAVYIKSPLKTDYKPERLYFATWKKFDEGFYAEKNGVQVPIEKMLRHRFLNKYNSRNKTSCLAEGEDFVEPSEFHPYWRCSSGDNDHDFYNENTWTLNEKGLFENYILLYYPPDTSLAAKKEYEISRENYLRAGGAADPDFPPYPRSREAVVTVLYTVRYEYHDPEKD